jgi:type III secretion protein R
MVELLSPTNAYAGPNLVALLALVLLATAVFICFSGFVKYAIVLNIIKNAIGTQQIPPTIVVNMLAGLMALNGIWPHIEPGLTRIKPLFVSNEVEQSIELDETFYEEDGSGANTTMYDLLENPFEYFPEMLEHVKSKTKELTNTIDIPITFESDETTFKYFLGGLIYDLYRGFEVGLKIYLIFVSIDFLIAVILSGVGMTMLSPTVISTPVKLAVFYFSDSWTILFKVLE